MKHLVRAFVVVWCVMGPVLVEAKGHARSTAHPVRPHAGTTTSGSRPPGLSKQDKVPAGLKKQDKTPAGLGEGKKTGGTKESKASTSSGTSNKP